MHWSKRVAVFGLLHRVWADSSASQHVKTDVIVVGGGSAGTYAAIQLHDLGKEVILLEKKDHIGGHVDSYVDPVTGDVKNFGVQIFYEQPEVHEYFERLGVNLTRRSGAGGGGGGVTSVAFDFQAGKVATRPPSDPAAVGAAFAKLSQIMKANYSYLEEGNVLPDPVPEDLLLPYREFAIKHGVEATISTVNGFNAPNEAWKEMTFYSFKSFPRALVDSFLTGALYATRDVGDLYKSAAAVLGPKLLTNAGITSVARTDGGVIVQVSTPSGCRTIRAKKLLMTGYPLVRNLAGWDLTPTESNLFSRFHARSYLAGIIKHPGLNGSISVSNVAPNQPYGIPQLPGVISLGAMPGFTGAPYVSYVGARDVISPDAAKQILIDGVDKLEAAGVISPGDVEFVRWSDHSPFKLEVTADEIREGFYTDLYALQGVKSTWWSGAAFHSQDSSGLWHFTKNLVNRMVAE